MFVALGSMLMCNIKDKPVMVQDRNCNRMLYKLEI